MLYKNVLVVGPPRAGKSTLSRKISKELNYNLISIDDLVSAFQKLPVNNIEHDGNSIETSKNIEPFLEGLFTEISEGANFYGGIKYVIEGTHIDFEHLIPFLRTEKMKDKFIIIGLTYDETEEDMFKAIRKYDTEDEWTYWNNDEELLGNVRYFLERNTYFKNKYDEYNITNYNTSNREKIFEDIIKELKNRLESNN